ncbi:unnamed protein product [Closterium sp. Yama58-4]|nr:unnamed protein product [Closterium sp. Yama58-4]
MISAGADAIENEEAGDVPCVAAAATGPTYKAPQKSACADTIENEEGGMCLVLLQAFNILLDIYRKNNLFADVAWVMDELAASGIKPDVITWNTLICCYGQAQMLPKVEATVEAKRRSGCRPNRRTYNGLIDAFGRCGSAADTAAVFEAIKCACHGVTWLTCILSSTDMHHSWR